MTTFTELMQEADARGLVRKVKRAMGFLAPMTVELPDALTDETSNPVDLKSMGFLPVGIVSPEGWRFARDVEKDEIDALGYSRLRSDTMRVARSVTFNPLEFGRRHLEELKRGMDLSGVTPDATSGEVVYDEPDIPVDREYRLVVIADDGPLEDNWIMGRGFGTVKLASTSEEAWGREGAAGSGDITLDVFNDEDLGTPVRHYLGGTGAKKSVDVLGYA